MTTKSRRTGRKPVAPSKRATAPLLETPPADKPPLGLVPLPDEVPPTAAVQAPKVDVPPLARKRRPTGRIGDRVMELEEENATDKDRFQAIMAEGEALDKRKEELVKEANAIQMRFVQREAALKELMALAE